MMRIGAYEVLFELARGGMGTVYLARAVGPRGIERLVAIKRAHEQTPEAQKQTDRFLDEAQITAFVHHANVVGMHHVGRDEQGYFLVFDYVEGESLDGLVASAAKRGTYMPVGVVLRIVMDALAGLQATHEATDTAGRPLGILHRDVSTQNLLVGRDGVTRLADFGIAKSTLSSVVTEEGYVQGKLFFLAPEYLQRRPVNRTLDIYSMSVTCWMALAGRSPWAGASPARAVQAILSEGVPWLSSIVRHVPVEVSAVVARGCAPDPAQRFQTARGMLDDLERVAKELNLQCSHLDVAQYVESVAGPDLAARRAAIGRACCAPSPAARETSSDTSEPVPQRLAVAASQATADGLGEYVATDDLRRRWEKPSRWPIAVVVAVVLAGATASAFLPRRPATGEVTLPSAADPPPAAAPRALVPRVVASHAEDALPVPPSGAAEDEMTLVPPPPPRSAAVKKKRAPVESKRRTRLEPFSAENPYE